MSIYRLQARGERTTEQWTADELQRVSEALEHAEPNNLFLQNWQGTPAHLGGSPGDVVPRPEPGMLVRYNDELWTYYWLDSTWRRVTHSGDTVTPGVGSMHTSTPTPITIGAGWTLVPWETDGISLNILPGAANDQMVIYYNTVIKHDLVLVLTHGSHSQERYSSVRVLVDATPIGNPVGFSVARQTEATTIVLPFMLDMRPLGLVFPHVITIEVGGGDSLTSPSIRSGGWWAHQVGPTIQ